MKIPLIYLLIFWGSLNSFAQTNNFQAILDSGKKEFRAQFVEAYPDYSKAYVLLKQAVSIQPNHAEARYFFGYLLDKMNMLRGMDSVDKELTLDVSEQLEIVNKLQPHYKGELMLLDPYSKLTANWGSLAFSYLNKSKKDSANWAFKEGKKRGAFCEGILEFNRQILNSCERNSILVVTGDNVSFPCSYLQNVEKFREDILLIDHGMLNGNWYYKFIKKDNRLKLAFRNVELDTLEFMEWQPTTIKVIDPKGKKPSLDWELKATYGGFLLKSDLALLEIVKNYFFLNKIYFLFYADSSSNIFLDNHLMIDGFLKKVVSDNIDPDKDYQISENFQKYSISNLPQEEIVKSQDVILAFNGLRIPYLILCNVLMSRGKKKEANDLFRDMETRFPINKLPFYDKDNEDYYLAVKSYIE